MASSDEPSTVSVIGMGEMGAALARALLAAGHAVTVWNRSTHKCEPCRQAGAAVAGTLEAAADASEVLVVCVADVAAIAATVHQPHIAARLAGKTLIQFTSRTPAQARAGGAWAAAHGIRCLEGAIFAYPPAVGTPEGTLVVAGAHDVYASMKSILGGLGGHVLHSGEDIGSAAALDLGVVGTFVPGAVVAFLQGAALATAEGSSLATYLTLVERHAYPMLAAPLMKLGVAMMQTGDYAYQGQGAPLSVWLAGLELARTAAEEAGVEVCFADAVTEQLRGAVRAGHGQAEMPAIYELLKSARVGSRQTASDVSTEPA